jgi:transglutaminase-like putative cysteine protease
VPPQPHGRYTHTRLTFGYQHASKTRTAWEAFREQRGVCRDFAHLAIPLCRCMNIPARYCTGYLGDIGVPPAPEPMDFSVWFEARLGGPGGGRWYTFDARHNHPRVGRILMARGRDATDVALSTSFGHARLAGSTWRPTGWSSRGQPPRAEPEPALQRPTRGGWLRSCCQPSPSMRGVSPFPTRGES